MMKDAGALRGEIEEGARELRERGLHEGAAWLADLAFSIPNQPTYPPTLPQHPLDASERGLFEVGKSLFDLKEYLRATHVLRNGKGPRAIFLRGYSQFLV